jgi:NitT/TauT family transport system permease protein
VFGIFPSRGVWRRPGLHPVDLLVFAALLALLFGLLRLAPTEESAAAERPRSLVLDVLRRSAVPDLVARPLRPAGRLLDTITRPFGLAEHPLQRPAMRARTGDVFFFGAVSAVIIYGAWRALDYLHMHLGLGAFGHVFVLGAATFARVVVLLIVASIIWVPIGVWIGMNPRVSRLARPVVQALASFPANFVFPFAAAFFVAAGISLNIGGILLMALGAQWYILFNVIAGASAIPSGRVLPVLDDVSFTRTRARSWRCSASPGQANPPYCAASPA